MRFVFPLLVVQALTAACGTAGSRHIADDPATTSQVADASAASNAPIHSQSGWAAPVNFFLATGAPEYIVEAVTRAAHTWNDAIGRDVLIYKGRVPLERTGNLYDSLDDEKTVVYYERAWTTTTTKPRTTLATTIWENDTTSHEAIVRGDIILNGQTYLFQDSTQKAVTAGREADIVDSETVLLHEMGHLLGLDHTTQTDDPDSVMHSHTYIGPNIFKRDLSEGDKGNIRSIYVR